MTSEVPVGTVNLFLTSFSWASQWGPPLLLIVINTFFFLYLFLSYSLGAQETNSLFLLFLHIFNSSGSGRFSLKGLVP